MWSLGASCLQTNRCNVTTNLLIAECIQNWSETFVVENACQDFRSETLLVETKHILEEEVRLFTSEHLIVQTDEILDYTMTETRKEHRSLAIASSEQTV